MALPKSSLTPDALIEESPAVRIVQVRQDPYTGLKGRAYIQARNLNQQVQRVQTSAQAQSSHRAEVCSGR